MVTGATGIVGGPEALSVADRVHKLGTALGRKLHLVEVPTADVSAAAAKAGRRPLVVETTLGDLGRKEFRRHAARVLPTLHCY